MRPFSFRLRLSAMAWIAIGSTLGFSSGCQQWSLRKNMGSFLGGEPKDDWEPPVNSSREEADPDAQAVNDMNRPWWSKRKGKDVQRVVLPRDRMAAAPRNAIESSSTPPKLPVAELVPQSRSGAAARTAGMPPATQQTASASESNTTKPHGELVAFGANPAGWPGEVLAPPREAASNTAMQTNMIDTGVQDADLEATLQSLPPQFREVVQRTLQAVKEGKSIEKTEPSGPVAVRFSDGNITSGLTSEPPMGGAPSTVALPTAAATTNGPAATLPSTPNFLNPPVSTANAAVANGALPPSNTTPGSNVALAVADSRIPSNVVATSASVPEKPSSTSDASIKSSTWHGVISEAIENLETDLESKPTADESLRRSQEITLRMLYVAQRRLDDALRPIERLEAHEQEYVRHQMQALYEASNPDANPAKARHWSSVMMSQREATAHLAAVSNLEVRSVAFCTQVDGYGTFQKFAKNQFASDQDVLLYCEIDNVAAEKVKLGYETQLQGSYEIRDNQGRLVADQDLPMEPEICSNHRRDYFIVYRIYMPSQLAPGNYELRLTIHDKKGGKYGHSSVAFEIRK